MMLSIDRLLKTESFKKVSKMAKLKVIMLMVLLMIPIISAAPSYIFKQSEPSDLKISCFDINNNLCNNAVTCYLTVHKPDQSNLYSNVTMTQSSNLDYWNYTLTGLDDNGNYATIVRCIGNTTGFSTFTFEVNPTGAVQTSILNNPMLLILGILALILIGMGVHFNSPWFGFIGSIMFVLGGVYTMIYGFNNVTDIYTRGISVVFIGVGIIFMFLAAYEWYGGEKE